jgi:hypothetical protein
MSFHMLVQSLILPKTANSISYPLMFALILKLIFVREIRLFKKKCVREIYNYQ